MENLVDHILPVSSKESIGHRAPGVRKEVIIKTSTLGPEGQWENASTGNLEYQDVNVILTVGFALEGHESEKETKG